MNLMEKLAKILLFIFIAVFSFTVLTRKIPEMEFIQSTVEHLEKNQNTVMAFSGSMLGTSLAISALPGDFGSPFAGTISSLNNYFVLLFAIIFVEKLIVLSGTEISLTYIIPAACILYIIGIITTKDIFKNLGTKILILGIALVLFIPASTHFTKYVCKDYMNYVDETIIESNSGAEKINEILISETDDATLFDKLSDAFKTAIHGISDLLTYFGNIIKKFENSIAILIIINFILPLLTLIFFRWLLNELFSLQLPMPKIKIKIPQLKQEEEMDIDYLTTEDDKE